MTFQENFNKIKELILANCKKEYMGRLAFQFNVIGEGSGIFYATNNDGVLSVEPYDYRDRDAAFTAEWDVFFNIVTKKTDPVKAFFTGRLKVDGSIEKALEIKKII